MYASMPYILYGRHIDRQRHTHRQTHRQTETETETDRDRERQRQMYASMPYVLYGRHIDRQRHTHRQTETETERDRDRCMHQCHTYCTEGALARRLPKHSWLVTTLSSALIAVSGARSGVWGERNAPS
jgi:hypothetical protein